MSEPVLRQPQATRWPASSTGIHNPLLALMLLALVALSLAYQVPVTVDLSQPGVVLSGFYNLEGRTSPLPHRWTNGHAQIWLAGLGRQPFHLVLTLGNARPDGDALPSVSVLAGEAALGTFKAPRPIRDIPFELGPEAQSLSGDLDLHIDSGTFAPPGDRRTLGIIVYSLRLETISEPHLVFPAPLSLVWSTLIISLLFLALRSWSLSTRLAWLLCVLTLAFLCLGIAAARLQTVASLPWAILLTTLLYVLSRTAARRDE